MNDGTGRGIDVIIVLHATLLEVDIVMHDCIVEVEFALESGNITCSEARIREGDIDSCLITDYCMLSLHVHLDEFYAAQPQQPQDKQRETGLKGK